MTAGASKADGKKEEHYFDLPEGVVTPVHTCAIGGDYLRLEKLLKDEENRRQYLFGKDDKGFTALHHAASSLVDSAVLTLHMIDHDAATTLDPVQDVMPELRINLLKDFLPIFGLQFPNDRVEIPTSKWTLVNNKTIAITVELFGAKPWETVSSCRTSMEMAELVIAQLKDRDSALMSSSYASDLDSSHIPKITHRYHARCFEMLVRAGSDVNKAEPVGVTPLHKVCANGLDKAAELLLGYGADSLAQDMYGDIPLHRAAWNGRTGCAELLLSRMAPGTANTKNAKKSTSLHFAAHRGHADTVKLLLQFGADCTMRDYVGWSPIHWSASQGHIKVTQALLDNHKRRDLVFKELETSYTGDNIAHLAILGCRAELILWLCKFYSLAFGHKNMAGESPLDTLGRLTRGDDGKKKKKGKGKGKKGKGKGKGDSAAFVMHTAGVFPTLTPNRIDVLKQLVGAVSKAT